MTKKANVIIDPNFRTMDEIFSVEHQKRLYDSTNVIWGKDDIMPQDQFLHALPDADVIICGEWRYGNVLDRASKLKAIIVVSGGFPLSLDYEYCYQHHIRVLSVAPAFARQVAEMTLGLALAASRDIARGDRAFRNGTELYLHEGNVGTFMLFDQPVGIIGYGSIGRVLHQLLLPFNVTISVYDPWLSNGYLQRHGLVGTDLDTVMSSSKIIFVLAAPTKENQAMLSQQHLEMIQPSSVLVLASRAHVIDFDVMTQMVLDGRFKVATDVFPTEPLSTNHPIRQADNAVLSAHRAGSVKDAMWEIGEMVVDDLEVILQGIPPRRLQNAEPELSSRYTSNKPKPLETFEKNKKGDP